MALRADITCSRCSRPARSGNVGLLINVPEASESQRERDAWRTEHAEDVVVLSTVTAMPATRGWTWEHAGCRPDRTGDYWIDGSRINTEAKALRWTWHLSQKTWFDAMAWSDLLARLFHMPDA